MAFGYGGEHNADLLRGVSEAGHRLFYYIDNTDSIPESFCDCLGGLLSVAAQVYTEYVQVYEEAEG